MANTGFDLNKTKQNKKDEFYTFYEDIEKELPLYKEYLKNKTILLPCDNSDTSNFFKFLYNHFDEYELKELISVGYTFDKPSQKVSYTKENGLQYTPLSGNGDFHHIETIQLIKDCDVVITNPPFSLFTDFMAILYQYDKDFIVLGNINALTTKIVWKMIMENKIWLGHSIHSGDRKFYVPDDYELNAYDCGMEDGKKYIKVKGVRWFTNIPYEGCYTPFDSGCKYEDNEYIKYDNYDAIEVSACKYLPMDYTGKMGVPITFFDKYNPKQFKILGLDKQLVKHRFEINGKSLYARILIEKI